MFLIFYFMIHFFFLYIGNFRLVKFLISCELCFLVIFFQTTHLFDGCLSLVIIFSSLIVVEAAMGLAILIKLNRSYKKSNILNKNFMSF